MPQLDGVKDLNELLLHLYAEGLGKDEVRLTFESLIASAPGIGKTNTKSKSDLALIEQTESDLRFAGSTSFTTGNCQVSYRLRGLFGNSETSLKLIVTAEDADRSYTDRFDLYSAKSRNSFAFHAAQRLELPSAKIEEDLSKLIAKLETLLLDVNRLETLPVQIGNLTELRGIHMNNNQLGSLPDEIGNLENIVFANLSHNALSQLPSGIGNWVKLEELYLAPRYLRCSSVPSI